MRHLLVIMMLACACLCRAQVSIITTICGHSTVGFYGDGGQATNALLNTPEFICLDDTGNVYISDGFNQRIRKIIISSGVIETIAGDGGVGYTGDSIAATSAEFTVPEAIASDKFGNIYIADAGNQRIRKVDASTGLIFTVAGNGSQGNAGDGASAIHAQLDNPIGLCVDGSGNIYIGDYSNNKVRRVDALTGVITTFAGKQGPPSYAGGFVGYTGDGGPATNAVLSGPIQVFADSAGNVYICDQWNHAVRKVDITTGLISTIAGTGTAGHLGDNGPATAAQLNQPGGMDMDKQGNIFIAEYGDGVIRRIDGLTSIITTVAGNDTLGFSGDGGPATKAELRCSDVRVDQYGTLYIADIDNNRIRKVSNPKLGMPNEPLQAGIVRLYPNPAGDQLSVIYDFSNGEDGFLQISDLLGRLIISAHLNASNQKEIVAIQNLTKGIYLYRVLQKNSVISFGEIIKE